MANNPDNVNCKNCKWYVQPNPNNPSGRCHLHPPINGDYPVTVPHFWCGDFAPNPNPNDKGTQQ